MKLNRKQLKLSYAHPTGTVEIGPDVLLTGIRPGYALMEIIAILQLKSPLNHRHAFHKLKT